MIYNIKENIEEYLVQLPREVQDTIRAFDWLSVVDTIGKENEFDEEERVDLQVATALVLVNIAPLDGLSVKIENTFGVTNEESKKIAEQISAQVFIPIANMVSEKLAAEIKDKNLDWGQNLNFILSGGDYLTTTEKTKIQEAPEEVVGNSMYIEERLLNDKNNG